MKSTLVLISSALWALTMAYPHVTPRADANGTDASASTADEPIPVFVLPCDCPAPVCDPRMNPESVSPPFVVKLPTVCGCFFWGGGGKAFGWGEGVCVCHGRHKRRRPLLD